MFCCSLKLLLMQIEFQELNFNIFIVRFERVLHSMSCLNCPDGKNHCPKYYTIIQKLSSYTYNFPSVFDYSSWMQQVLWWHGCRRCTSRSKVKGHRLRGVVFWWLYHPVNWGERKKHSRDEIRELDLLLCFYSRHKYAS